MKKSFDKLSDKVFELQTQLEKIDVLTNDLYSQYFALIDPAKPEAVDVINYYFKSNYVRCSIIREFMPEILKFAKEVCEEVDSIVK